MNLSKAEPGREYVVQRLETQDADLDRFLFTLGCYTGAPITVIARRRSGCTVSIKDGRYNVDTQLARAIVVA